MCLLTLYMLKKQWQSNAEKEVYVLKVSSGTSNKITYNRAYQMSTQWRIQGCIPLQKIKKMNFKLFLKVFMAHYNVSVCVCVSYYWECPGHFYKVDKDSYNPLTISGLHKNNPVHLLWHFKVTHQEVACGSIRVILPMQVRGQLIHSTNTERLCWIRPIWWWWWQ